MSAGPAASDVNPGGGDWARKRTSLGRPNDAAYLDQTCEFALDPELDEVITVLSSPNISDISGISAVGGANDAHVGLGAAAAEADITVVSDDVDTKMFTQDAAHRFPTNNDNSVHSRFRI